MPILLSNAEVEQLLSPRDCVEALEAGYRELGQGGAGFRPRSDLYAPTSHRGAFYRLRTMEGIAASLGVAAIRIGSDVVRWYEVDGGIRQEHVPAAQGRRWVGLVLLFDLHSSEPLLIFPDGALQRLRVGATTAIAARYLARPESSVLALLGAGNQARGALRCLAEVLPLKHVLLFSPNADRRHAFAAELSSLTGLEVTPMEDARGAVREADVVACATNSLTPVLDGAWIRAGMHFAAIEWCELDAGCFRRADVTVVHMHGGEVSNRLVGVSPEAVTGLHKHDMDAWMHALPGLSEVMGGAALGRTGPDQVTCFVNNVGCGLQFAAAGRRIYDLARQRGVGRELPLDWFLQDSPS